MVSAMTIGSTREADAARAPISCLWDGCALPLWHVGRHRPAKAAVGCEPRIEAREGGRLQYWNVKDNDRKGYIGRVARDQHAEVSPGNWVRLFGVERGQDFERVFRIGDEAAYSGYNFTYTGRIVAIGPKTVSVRDERELKRLSIYDFLAWNRRFNAERVRAENGEVSARI